MTTELMSLVKSEDFTDLGALAIEYKGKMCFIAREVGEAWGYADGGQGFRKLITEDWSDYFTIGKDLFILEGEELRLLKNIISQSKSSVAVKEPEPGAQPKDDECNLELIETIGSQQKRWPPLLLGDDEYDSELTETIGSQQGGWPPTLLENDELDSEVRVHPFTRSLLLITAEGLALAAKLSKKPEAVRFNSLVQFLLKNKTGKEEQSKLLKSNEELLLMVSKILSGLEKRMMSAVKTEGMEARLAEELKKEARFIAHTQALEVAQLTAADYFDGIKEDEKRTNQIREKLKHADEIHTKAEDAMTAFRTRIKAPLAELEGLVLKIYRSTSKMGINVNDEEFSHRVEVMLGYYSGCSKAMSLLFELQDRYLAASSLLEHQFAAFLERFQDPNKPVVEVPAVLPEVIRLQWTQSPEELAVNTAAAELRAMQRVELKEQKERIEYAIQAEYKKHNLFSPGILPPKIVKNNNGNNDNGPVEENW